MCCFACTTTLAQNIRPHALKSWIDSCRKSTALVLDQRLTRVCSLGLGVLGDFNKLRVDTQLKNIVAWTPVVAEIMQGFVRLDDKAVSGTALP